MVKEQRGTGTALDGVESSPILVALDVDSAEMATRLAKSLVDVVGGFKVGLELLSSVGPGAVSIIAELGLPVFCDAKLHDIPNTCERAARGLAAAGARWVTAHVSGGHAMLEATVDGLDAGAGGRPVGVLGVTVLTSLDEAMLASVGVVGTPGRQVARLSKVAAGAGCEGVICSVRELGDVHQAAPGLVRVTPGIRLPDRTAEDDQVRVATPEEAVHRGADWLVVGRPITRAADPVAAAVAMNRRIVESGDVAR